MYELYETKFGICNHLNSKNPLSSIQFNSSEKYLDNYLYEGYLNTFLFKEVYKTTGISFDEFINRPRYEIESILKIVEEVNKKKMNINKSVLKNLDKGYSKDIPDPNLNLE